MMANRGCERTVKRKRWIKFSTYYVITHLLMIAILAGGRWFSFLAIVIVLAGVIEIIKVTGKGRRATLLSAALITCAVAGYGFIRFSALSAERILFIYLLTVVFDGFSQLSGQLFGRHKLMSKVSPNKTVEGLVGGALCTIVTACLIRGWVGFSVLQCIYISVGLCVAALIGDLLASAYKRKVGVKDYSNILPGHGGILDRFDSFIATGACFYVYFLFL